MAALDAYRKLKEDHPEAYTALAILPVSGQIAAMADYADALDRGDSADGAIAAASLIPGVKLAKYASKLAPATLRLKSQMNVVEKAIAPVVKQSDKVGKAMGVEQASEYAGKKISAHAAPIDHAAKEREEYSSAWNEQPHESFKINGSR
jgi:hypothetical protein